MLNFLLTVQVKCNAADLSTFANLLIKRKATDEKRTPKL